MDTDFEMILIACLDALDAGESIEQVLARYPDTAAALRPLLETAAALPGLALQPSASAQADSRRAFLNRAAELPATRRRLLGLPLRLGAAIALLAALLTVGGGTVAASASAVPGDALYGVKRTVEQVEVALAPDKQQIARELEQRRRNEVQLLMRADRPAAVTFTGVVEAIDGDSWRVDGISVTLDPSTRVEGTPQVGAQAVVAGRTDGSFVRATEIMIVPGSAPPPTAMPAPTLAPTATPAPTRAPSPTVATSLPTAVPPSPTLVPTLVPTPRPALPTRAPTATPAPPPEDNNDNDNSSDDSGNDNSGDENDNSGDENDNSGDDNDNSGDDGGNDNSGDENDNSGDENDNSGDDNDNSGDDSGNDNSGDENDNSGDDNDNSGDENDNSGDDSGNDNSGDGNDNSGDDSGGGDSGDNSGSGSGGGTGGEDDD